MITGEGARLAEAADTAVITSSCWSPATQASSFPSISGSS